MEHQRGEQIVTRSGFGRGHMLALFVAMDAIAVGVIAWLLLR